MATAAIFLTLASTSGLSATNAGNPISIPGLRNLSIELNVTGITGGGTTLDVYVQTSMDGGVTWLDIVHFAQFTTVLGPGFRFASVCADSQPLRTSVPAMAA